MIYTSHFVHIYFCTDELLYSSQGLVLVCLVFNSHIMRIPDQKMLTKREFFTPRLHVLPGRVLSWWLRMLWWYVVLRRGTLPASRSTCPNYWLEKNKKRKRPSSQKPHRWDMWRSELLLLLWRSCLSITAVRVDGEVRRKKPGYW